MLRKLAPPHLLLAAYCAGLMSALCWRPPGWALALGAGLCALAWLAASRVSRPHPPSETAEHQAPAPNRLWRAVSPAAVLSLALLLAGIGVGGARLAGLERSEIAERMGETVMLTAVLTDLPDIDEGEVSLALDVTALDEAPVEGPAHVRLTLEGEQRFELDPCGPLSEGALLEVSGVRVRPLPEAKPGAFDYGRYLRRRGEHALLDGEFAQLRVTGRRDGVRGAIDGLRRASRAHLQAGLSGPVRAVLQGMVLGDDEGVDQATIEDFRRSGLLHIMAVSGENVVLLCGMWAFAFTLLAIPRLVRTALLVPVVATYVVLTGASPSIVRAGVAGIVGLLAVMASRPSDGWLLWLAPGAWLLSANPNNVFDVSFQLSFGAVAGLLILARPLTRGLAFLPGPLPEQVGVTAAASLATAPVSMLTFGSASLVSVPANVAGGFVLGPIMFLGMLSLLLGFVSSWLSVPLNMLAGLFIGFLLAIARLFGRLPGAVYEWQGVTLGLASAVMLVALAGAVIVLARRAGESPLRYLRSPRRRLSLASACGLALAAALVLAPRGPAAPALPTATFLDVGEGASTLVQVPSGPTVLIDAGPAPLARELRAHGVRRIDLLVLSHGHADHTAGLSDVIGRVPIEAALLPQPPQPSAALERLAGELYAAGTVVRRVSEELCAGGEGWAVRVLVTEAAAGSADENQNENDCALVVLAELGGQRILLPGDAEGEVLSALDLPRCDVVAVPHHGSAGGLDEGLLRALAPRLAVIPVGPNTYGHPADEVLSLLSTAQVPCARTDQHGDIAVSPGSDGPQVRLEKEWP